MSCIKEQLVQWSSSTIDSFDDCSLCCKTALEKSWELWKWSDPPDTPLVHNDCVAASAVAWFQTGSLVVVVHVGSNLVVLLLLEGSTNRAPSLPSGQSNGFTVLTFFGEAPSLSFDILINWAFFTLRGRNILEVSFRHSWTKSWAHPPGLGMHI